MTKISSQFIIHLALNILSVLLSSRSGLGLKDPRGHHYLEVLALASGGQVLALALALVMQVLALALALKERF